MRYGFRKICRRCGANLVLVPRLFHSSHVRVFVAGPRAALAELTVTVIQFAIAIAVLALLGKACHQ
jgi:hypothetical protein